MRSNQRSLLAVDLTPHQIRVVEMQGRASSAQTLRTAVGPMPENAFSGDRITDADAVGTALRKLVESMGAASREAVFGIPPGSITTQVAVVPPAPDNEMPRVLENELEHLKVIRPDEGVFNYTRLAGPAGQANGADAGEVQMLVMAADKTVVNTYRDVAGVAGLKMLGLEPTLLAMYRIGWQLGHEQAGVVYISINRNKCEIALVEEGRIRLYRRVEIGTDGLFPTSPTASQGNASPLARPSILGEEPEPDVTLPFPGSPPASPSMPRPMTSGSSDDDVGTGIPLSVPAARSLAQELRRSLEYYRRENPSGSPITQALIMSDSPDIAPFAPWLMQELELGVRLARPSEVSALGQVPPAYVTAPNANPSGYGELALLPALGLGLGMLPDQPVGVPHFDLAGEQRANATLELARHYLTMALAAALVMVLAGAGVTIAIGSHANDVAHEVAHLQADLLERQQTQQVMINRIQAQQNELAVLQKRGFPFPRMMDAVTSVLAPQTALTEVDLDKTGKLTVMGSALNDRGVVTTLDGMRSISWFEIPTLDSFDRKAASQNTPSYISFKILTQLANMRPATALGPNGTVPAGSGAPGSASATPQGGTR